MLISNWTNKIQTSAKGPVFHNNVLGLALHAYWSAVYWCVALREIKLLLKTFDFQKRATKVL